MIATIQARDGLPCVVHRTGRRGLRVVTTTYCGEEVGNASEDVIQVPERSRVCEKCLEAIAKL